ncbi:MAG: amidohydrolase family protein [Acidobacteriota bacterium]
MSFRLFFTAYVSVFGMAAQAPESARAIVISGATLIDVVAGKPVPDAVVVVEGEKIVGAGPRGSVEIPTGAEVIHAPGQTLLPGLIDAHFHLDGNQRLPGLFLTHGVTSVRDPGAWIEAYDPVRESASPIPRLFLAGPHLDTPPPAYPHDAYIVRDPEETRGAVNRFIDQGASVIKVYFRLPLELIAVAAETAHDRDVPVTAHLEIVSAADAIRAGVDGIEHITSFGTALLPLREAEEYRQSVLADNHARSLGRYQVFSRLDLNSSRAQALIDLMLERGTFVSATLAIFERRPEDEGASEAHLNGFKQMQAFVGQLHKAGVRIVVGSHSSVPHAQEGWAYQRELELLVESGLSPMDAIIAGTLQNARFFRIEDRLGSIEAGKLADLVLVEGNPLQDISAMRRVKGVMLNGRWISSNSDVSLMLRAQQAIDSGQLDEAASILQAVLKSEEGHKIARQTLIDVLMRLGRWDEAEAQVHLLRLKFPKDAESALLASSVAFRVAKFELAGELARESMELHADPAAALKLLALSRYMLQDFEGFEANIKELILLAPGDSEAHYHLGRYYYEQETYVEAAASLQKAVELDPEHYKAHYYLGWCRQAEGNYDASRESYQRAIAIIEKSGTRYGWAYADLGDLLILQGNYEEGLGWLYRGIRNDPELPYTHFKYAAALLTKETTTEVENHLQKSISLDPAYAEAYYQLGRYYRKVGDQENALKSFAKFKELRENPTPSVFGLRR